MSIKCDQCDRDATVHEVSMRNGVRMERHLCERCALDAGMTVQPGAPVTEIIKQVMTQGVLGPLSAPQQRKPAPPAACPGCSMTFAEFKQTGLLGCAMCYATFEAQLGPLIERAHEGGTAHTGKVPRRRGDDKITIVGEASPPHRSAASIAQRAKVVKDLRRQLEAAVASERYEKAAELRDQLRRLEASEAEISGADIAGPDISGPDISGADIAGEEAP